MRRQINNRHLTEMHPSIAKMTQCKLHRTQQQYKQKQQISLRITVNYSHSNLNIKIVHLGRVSPTPVKSPVY